MILIGMIVNDMNKVSIIVPVYNVKQYLYETIEGICQQKYNNLEILIIDDGSTDGSGTVCDDYALKDKRIKVFHIKNSGVSKARNFAIDHSTGDYIVFVDSDDLIKPNFILIMLEAAIKTNAEIVTCKYMEGKKYLPEEFIKYKPKEKPRFSVIPIENYRTTNYFRHNVIWAGLYKASIIKKMYFDPELLIGEDTFYFAELLSISRKITFVDEIYYYYRLRLNSLVNERYDPRFDSGVKSWERVCELFSGESKEFLNECKVALGFRCKKNLELIIESNYADKDKKRELHIKMLKCVNNIILSKEIGIKQKITYILFIISPSLYIKGKKTINCLCIKLKSF